MPALQTSGTQSATIDTVHTLATVTAGKTYVLVVDLANLAGGDIVEIEIWTKVLSGDSSQLAYKAVYAHAQVIKNVYSVPVPANIEFVAKLQQTDGTGRSFKWAILNLEG